MKCLHRPGLWLLMGVVVANYLAQILYYFHQYYLPHHTPPNLTGTILLALTFVWFMAGYVGVARGKPVGFWLLVAFLIVEVGFYAENLLVQIAHGYPPFMHLQARDPILFVVFGIGYLNLFAGAYSLYVLVRQWVTGWIGVGSRGISPWR